MSESTAPEKRRCKATTKAGAPCRNYALAGSDYCRVHQHLAQAPASQPEAPSAATAQAEISAPEEAPAPQVTPTQAAAPSLGAGAPGAELTPEDEELFRRLSQELNELVQELRREEPEYTPPPFSPTGLVALIRDNLYRFTPEAQREIIEQLRSNFAGTRPRDLVDPETWKGFWYVLNYLAQQQAGSTLERLNQRLARIPGFALLSDIREGLKDAKPSDFLDPETWKGLLYIANYSAKLQIQEMKRRILGEPEESEGEEEA